MNIINILKNHPFFKSIDAQSLELIAISSRLEKIINGTYIARRGEKSRRLILVINGYLELSITNREGKKHVVNQLAPGNIFGLIPVLDDSESIHDAIAHKNCRLLIIPQETIKTIIKTNTDFNEKIIKILCKRARMNYETIASITLKSNKKRLAKKLIDLFSESKKEELNINQTQISEMLGISRQSTNKELKKIEKHGAIKISRSNIKLLNEEKLIELTI